MFLVVHTFGVAHIASFPPTSTLLLLWSFGSLQSCTETYIFESCVGRAPEGTLLKLECSSYISNKVQRRKDEVELHI